MFFMDFATQRRLGAYKFALSVRGDVPAANGSSAGAFLAESKLQQNWSFWSELLAISYTTLEDSESGDVDDGVNHLSCQFMDGANQLALSNDFVGLATIAAPGRQRAPGVSGDPSNALAIDGGIPWPHLYLSTGSVKMDMRNDADTVNSFEAVYNGYLIPDANLGLFDQWIMGQSIAGSGPQLTPEQLVQGLAGLMGRHS